MIKMIEMFVSLFVKDFIVKKQIKIDILSRLGLADRDKCESALQRTNWNVELAASSILESA